MELLIRRPGTVGGTSPFDEAVRTVARSGPRDLACPYRGVEILRSLKSFPPALRLVTDVEKWLRTFADDAVLYDTRCLTETLAPSQGDFDKANGSPNASSHLGTLLRAAADPAYRKSLFDLVHWNDA